MNSPTTERVGVVGAGIIGSALACTLQSQGYAVSLIDDSEDAARASYGNAGFLATELIEPLATKASVRAAPGMWWRSDQPLSIPITHMPHLAPWLWRFLRAASDRRAAGGRAALSILNQRSVGAWQRLLSDYGLETMLERCGYLMTWESPKGREAATRHAAHLARWGVACSLLDSEAVREREPALSRSISHALYFPEAHRVIDPQQILSALQDGFVARGGQWLRARVGGLSPEADGVRCHFEDGDDAVFDRIAICAGAWSHQLLRSLNVRVPLETERGYHLTFGSQAPSLRHAVGSAERRVVLNDLRSGLRIVGFTELAGLERPPEPGHFDVLARHAKALLAEGDGLGEVVSRWMGFRPSLPDSLPVIDQLPAHPRVLCAFGHQHLGVTQAAITAELLSERMTSGDAAIDLSPYSITRF